ncbi:MAG: universal stress protein [Candidatus Rokubacteria bacterium]|nr:universal stress protein [Candidatus Rokubacteria bacterium]
MKISEILLPTDFSAAAEAAALVATAMARETGARLHVVHVVPPATDPSLGSEQLTRLGRQLGTGLALELALLSGRAAREITAYARDKGIDLIVMSTHGRTGVSRTLLGSVAEAVVRLSPCLVLTVPMALPTAGTPAASLAHAGAPPVPHRCIVCAGQTDDLVCETCRARIRGEALEHKIESERAGRRGSSA